MIKDLVYKENNRGLKNYARGLILAGTAALAFSPLFGCGKKAAYQTGDDLSGKPNTEHVRKAEEAGKELDEIRDLLFGSAQDKFSPEKISEDDYKEALALLGDSTQGRTSEYDDSIVKLKGTDDTDLEALLGFTPEEVKRHNEEYEKKKQAEYEEALALLGFDEPAKTPEIKKVGQSKNDVSTIGGIDFIRHTVTKGDTGLSYIAKRMYGKENLGKWTYAKDFNNKYAEDLDAKEITDRRNWIFVGDEHLFPKDLENLEKYVSKIRNFEKDHARKLAESREKAGKVQKSLDSVEARADSIEKEVKSIHDDLTGILEDAGIAADDSGKAFVKDSEKFRDYVEREEADTTEKLPQKAKYDEKDGKSIYGTGKGPLGLKMMHANASFLKEGKWGEDFKDVLAEGGMTFDLGKGHELDFYLSSYPGRDPSRISWKAPVFYIGNYNKNLQLYGTLNGGMYDFVQGDHGYPNLAKLFGSFGMEMRFKLMHFLNAEFGGDLGRVNVKMLQDKLLSWKKLDSFSGERRAYARILVKLVDEVGIEYFLNALHGRKPSHTFKLKYNDFNIGLYNDLDGDLQNRDRGVFIGISKEF